MKFTDAVLMLFFYNSLVFADIGDTVIVLKEVEARGVRFGKYTPGAKVFVFDSAIRASFTSQSVAELLAMRSLASVNSYGPEGLASVCIRGGSSRHTAVIWNGFNLRSPSSGAMNFSCLPAGFFDEIALQPGGSSTMYGSGASTGAIFIGDKLAFGRKTFNPILNLEGGSFGKKSLLSSLAYISPVYSGRIKIGYQHSNNNFRYKYGNTINTLEHAAFKRLSVSQQNAFKIGALSRLETNFWYTQLDKEIPSSITDVLPGTAHQTDRSTKTALSYSGYGANWSLLLRSGLFFDEVDYISPSVENGKSHNQSISLINEIECRYTLSYFHSINIGFNNTYEHASSSGYSSVTGRLRNALYARYNIAPVAGRLVFAFEGRQEFLESSSIPFVYSFNSNAELARGLVFKSVFSKHYSLPVFDDLFWAEDAFAKGNPNLKPEYGYNFETGINYTFKNNLFRSENEITIYRNSIYDLIKWLPDNVPGKPSKYIPTNITYSKTLGLEYSGSVQKKIQNLEVGISFLYGYTHAQYFDSLRSKSGYQGFYIPKHKVNLAFTATVYRFGVSFACTYNSIRYVNVINELPAYLLGNIELNYRNSMGKFPFSVFFKVNNAFNTNYQVMSGYAQPLRNYGFGMNISL
ncbi:MAG: TonB-dependent receptor [Bacteroidales bacterium]|nr:TonB-dependent receptor [Bacteroidales bacterium]